MRRVVAEYLEPRLCRDAISVGLTVVPVDDAVELLRAGLVWSARYDRGRLVGEASAWGLMASGRVELARRWAQASEYPHVVERVLRGETIELAGLSAGDLADARLAQRCLGRALVDADVEEIAARAISDTERWQVRQLRELLAGTHRIALTDEPIELLEDDLRDEPIVDIYDYTGTGDHAGCLRRLAAAIAHAKTLPPARRPWYRLARLCRFLTDDDAAAMALLERTPLPEAHDDWIETFGPLGVARIQRAKDAVLAAIEQAFDGVPFPGPKARSLFQAEAADSYRGCDQSRDHKGRWQDIPREQILACQFAAPHLSGESLQYYLPAILSLVVREHDHRSEDQGIRWIFESTEYGLQFYLDDKGRRDHAIDRYRCFTPAQFAAVAAFADYYRCGDEDRARWHALGRGEPWPLLIAPAR